MPDFERLIRKAEIYFAPTEQEKQYRRGRHDGIDFARWQFIKCLIGFFIGHVIYKLFF